MRYRRFREITGEDNLTVFSYSGRVKSAEWRWQRRRADLRYFEIFRHGPIIIYTRLPAGGTYYPICTFPASSECLIGISDAFSAFVYGCPSSSPRAHCTPNKSVPILRYTRRHGHIYTGPCPKALTECSPLDFRRSSISSDLHFDVCAALLSVGSFIDLQDNEHLPQYNSCFCCSRFLCCCCCYSSITCFLIVVEYVNECR